MPEERCELIDRELHLPLSPSFEHQDIATQLIMVAGSFIYQRVYSPENLEGEVYGKGNLEPITIPGLKINIPSLFQ